jgi:sulfur carrier protein ThiS
MKIRADLYGTLSQKVPGYRHSQGIEMDIVEGTTVSDLLALLEIDMSQKAIVAIDGRICKPNDQLPAGARARIFQPVHGG